MKKRNNNEPQRSVLFVIPDQFGYSAGYYYYCKYLLEAGYRVGVLSFDIGKKKIELEGEFESLYITPHNALQYRWAIFKRLLVLKHNYDVVVFKQMPGLFFIALLVRRTKRILDVRTGSVHDGVWRKRVENHDIWMQSLFFNKVFILSIELAKDLKIPATKYVWLPLGADEIAVGDKDYKCSMQLLYVGTFDYRNIYQAVEGFALFKQKRGQDIPLSFDIIGNGSKEAVKKIEQVIEKYGLQRDVILHGYLTHQEARDYYEKCNIGISYIPVLPCFKNQPPTKTYEYVLSGLVCLGTKTNSNMQLINSSNGILHNDTSESFCAALEMYYKNRKNYRTSIVKASLKNYKWKIIVNKILKPELRNG